MEISRKNIRAAISPPALSFKKRKSALIKEKKNEGIMIDPLNVGQEYPCTGRKNLSIRANNGLTVGSSGGPGTFTTRKCNFTRSL